MLFRQKFYKLKKESEALLNGASTSAAATPATKTPKSGSGRKRKNNDEDAADGDATPTPAKRKRASPKKKAEQVTKEPIIKDENGTDVEESVKKEKKVEIGVETDEKEARTNGNAD
jgi:hypothetical protein